MSPSLFLLERKPNLFCFGTDNILPKNQEAFVFTIFTSTYYRLLQIVVLLQESFKLFWLQVFVCRKIKLPQWKQVQSICSLQPMWWKVHCCQTQCLFFVATTGGSEMFIFYTAFFTSWIKNPVAFSFTQTSSVSIQCFSTELAISHLETVIKAALSS